MDTPISYEDLLRGFSGSVAVYNQDDQDTLWVRVFYAEHERKGIDYDLKRFTPFCIPTEMNRPCPI